jgi:integrase
VANDEDPQASKKQTRKESKFTLKAVIPHYLDTKRAQVRASTFNQVSRYLTDSWQPLHGMPISAIARRDVAYELGKMTRKSGSTTAARARSALSTFFAWCLGEGLCEGNPCVGTNRPGESKPRERVLSDAELAAIWHAAPPDNYGRIIKLLILSGCRREEIGGLKESEIDTENRVLRLPPERTKSGKAHVVPLSDLAWSILSEQPRLDEREHVFAHARGQGGFSWSRAKADLDKRLGESVREWRTHDLRRTAATRMADLGVMPHVIEAVLGHHSGHKAGTAGIYNRSGYPNEVRNALMMWSDHVRALVEGGERRVIHMPQRTTAATPASA